MITCELNGLGQPHKIQNSYFCLFSPAILAYRDDDGNPMVLSVVSRVEKQLAEEIAAKTLNHEYLSIDGLRSFTQAACKLCLGGDSPAIAENRVRYIFISSLCVNNDTFDEEHQNLNSHLLQTCQLSRFCRESHGFLSFLTASRQDSSISRFLGEKHSEMKY